MNQKEIDELAKEMCTGLIKKFEIDALEETLEEAGIEDPAKLIEKAGDKAREKASKALEIAVEELMKGDSADLNNMVEKICNEI